MVDSRAPPSELSPGSHIGGIAAIGTLSSAKSLSAVVTVESRTFGFTKLHSSFTNLKSIYINK
jgi:hypothetical protein